ncbi:polyribonucleotide nucleotidyltransferase [bacterium]|nr:polyribonucleotide nucleotidyltransferase [bacterium]
MHTVEAKLGDKTITIETGHLAKQANGAVTVRCGDTIVLVTATASKEAKEDRGFFPLTVDYVEKTFAAGKIPGGFFKREGRPSEHATLTSRFIDRPIRPLFQEGYMNETQIIATILSVDLENDPDVLAIVGASAALTISEVPFLGPIAGVRVGRVKGEFVLNAKPEDMDESDIDVIVVGSKDAVVMVEGGARIVPEKDMIDAIMFAHKSIQPLIEAQKELAKKCKTEKWKVEPKVLNKDLVEKIEKLASNKLKEALVIKTKQERYAAIDEIKAEIKKNLVPEDDDGSVGREVSDIFGNLKSLICRSMILNEKKRIDGRSYTEVRPITCEIGLLPRAHGSGVFTRGETQALAATTLGTAEDQQRIDSIAGDYRKTFMLHYNFPPYSVGEVKFLKSPGRREVGHGALAERSLKQVLPTEEEFPYTIRIVSEVLESNGSSSMATVCSGSLSLMDAGVPIKSHVAGIAMGLVKEDKNYVILSDILGDEDHMGDMDFKITGTKEGVTAIQMDIKITGITEDILTEALNQAREGRLHILSEMEKVIDKPRAELSKYAPRIVTLKIQQDQIGGLIGPGGKNIRKIVEDTGAKIDIDDDGTVHVASSDGEAIEQAIRMIKNLTAVPEVGKYYKGTVRKIMDFGAFVEVIPGTDGLVHISQLENHRVKNVTDVVQEGDEVVVKVLEIEPGSCKIRLSRKDAVGHESEVE